VEENSSCLFIHFCFVHYERSVVGSSQCGAEMDTLRSTNTRFDLAGQRTFQMEAL
jgi:hypothetical protein